MAWFVQWKPKASTDWMPCSNGFEDQEKAIAHEHWVSTSLLGATILPTETREVWEDNSEC